MRFTDLQSYSFEHCQRLTRYCPPLFTGDRQDSNPTCRHFHATRCSSTQPVHNLVVKCSTVFLLHGSSLHGGGQGSRNPQGHNNSSLVFQFPFFKLWLGIIIVCQYWFLWIIFSKYTSSKSFWKISFGQGHRIQKKWKNYLIPFFISWKLFFFLSFRPFTWPRSEDPLKKPQMASKLQNHTA